jgi:1-deoxy-D-xylulose-5-phosphate synthase
MLDTGLLDSGRPRLRSLVLPDRFIDHGTPAGQYEEAGLNAGGIVAAAMRALGQPKAATRPAALSQTS